MCSDCNDIVMKRNSCIELMRQAMILHQGGKLEEAESFYEEVIRIDPDHADALHLLGAVSYQMKKYKKAIAYTEKALRLKPENNDLHTNLGNAHLGNGETEAAIFHYRRAIELNKGDAISYYNLGNAYKEQGAFDDAVKCYEKALQINPEMAEAYYNYGNALQDKHHIDSLAIPYYRKTISLKPEFAEAHWNLSLALLVTGKFNEGWKEYEWRCRIRGISPNLPFDRPLWDGSHDISGRTLLIYAEQGFGDVIQFIRYVPLISRLGAKVIIECQNELVSLLSAVDGVSEVYGRGEPLTDFDLQSPILSLPYLLGTDIATIPRDIPYIIPENSLVDKWRASMSKYESADMKVGLAWAGKPSHKRDLYRSFPLSVYAPLAGFKNITFFNLQKDDTAQDVKSHPEDMNLVELMGEVSDFSDTAAFIENLDLVISADTAVAHLAGAMGKPVWTLLPYAPDWRWLLDRSDSPWYPTMKLFRQSKPMDWADAIQKICSELSATQKGNC